MAAQTVELFKELDPKRVHQDPYTNDAGGYKQSKGFYINYYKGFLKDIKAAGLIDTLDQSGDISIQDDGDDSG